VSNSKIFIFFILFGVIGACAFGASRYSTNMQNTDDLPADIESCQARIRELSKRVESLSAIASAKDPQAVIAQQQRTIEELRKQLEELQAEQDKLQRMLARLIKGNKSERVILSSPTQAFLPFENQAELEAAQAEAQAEAEAILDDEKNRPKPKPRKRRSEALPEHLPRIEKIVEVPESMTVCDVHGTRQVVGYDIVEKLIRIPPQLYVERLKYPKLSCAGAPTCGIVSPERPTGLVEGDRYDTSIAATIIQAKWDHHMPVYRQQDLFAGSGWTPSRSTLLNIIASACFVIAPLIEYMRRRVQSDIGVGIDDTSCRMLLPQVEPAPIEGDAKSRRLIEKVREARAKGATSLLAKMWVYSGLSQAPYNIFDFRVSRHRDGPDEFFANSQCIVQGDCFSGNLSVVIRSDDRLSFCACWGHARRKLVDAKTYKDERETLIGLIQKLYDIETRAMDYSHEERQSLRMRESTLILKCIRTYIDSPNVTGALPRSDFAEAIRYITNHWDALSRYTEDGRIPIDNNRVEQLMKQVAMGRKAWLFVSNVESGERSAMLMSLVSSAKRHDLDVWVYLKDVLDQLLAGETDYEKLLPDRWKLDHPEAVRQYRVEERRDKADRKQLEAARRRVLAGKK
jgi:transposase